MLLDGMRGCSVPDYVRSMRRLAELPVETVYPGHGHAFDGMTLRAIADRYLNTRLGLATDS
jgi:glyoxylase-like metal-dependent hydrolase (beta-lactamase superfamily II)